jgi:adenylate cyclase
MGVEIERKFLVKDDSFLKNISGSRYIQGYLSSNGAVGTRIRIANNKGILTIKSAVKGISRAEFEYEIPLEDAKIMLHTLCLKPLISKTRYKIEYCGLVWDVDVFDGENTGLIMTEVELESETQQVSMPDWVDKEVTGKMRYYNSRLMCYPYSKWSNKEKKGT